MARLNIYMDDELAAKARAADFNISAACQQALRQKLALPADRRRPDGKARKPPSLGGAVLRSDFWVETLRGER